MENTKYAEFTGKVTEVDKKLDAAVREAHDTIYEMVKDMPVSEFVGWAKQACDDERVSAQIFHLVCMVHYNEVRKRFEDIKNALDKL